MALALVISLLLSLVIGLFSLRVKAIFFAMITLAVAAAFQTLASQLCEFTGGEDGLSFSTPELAEPVVRALRDAVPRRPVDGKIFTYYLLFVVVGLFLLLLRIVNSPFGRVLQAIRENDFRAEAIGYRTVVYRTLSNVLSALFATIAGALLALWLRYTGPDTTLSFEIMLDILLIVVIGGMGTMYGAVIGAVLFVLAQNYLQDLLKLGAAALDGVPVLPPSVSPDRWLLWLGVLFVLSVYHFPAGVVGRLRAWRARAATAEGAGREPAPAPPGAPEKPAGTQRRADGHVSRRPRRGGRAADLALRPGARPRDPLHRVGRTGRGDGRRLARPGAHRPRHGRHRRAPGASAGA